MLKKKTVKRNTANEKAIKCKNIDAPCGNGSTICVHQLD